MTQESVLWAKLPGWFLYIFMHWKEKMKVKSLSRVWLFVTPWTVAYQAPLSMGFSRQGYWSRLPFLSPGDRTRVSRIAGRSFTIWATREAIHALRPFKKVRASIICISDSFATPWTVAPKLLCPWDFPGKNTGVGCHFLLQGISDAGIEPASLHWQADPLPLSHQGSSR